MRHMTSSSKEALRPSVYMLGPKAIRVEPRPPTKLNSLAFVLTPRWRKKCGASDLVKHTKEFDKMRVVSAEPIACPI